jgi:hypothetical protein
MKTLVDYLIESTQQFEYRIKIAGELTNENLKDMEHQFSKFDMVSMSKPRRTPVMKDPLGFEGLKNEEINIIDVIFNYPANTEQFMETIRQIGIPNNRVVVINKQFNDSMNAENEEIEDTNGEALLNSDLPQSTQSQLEASNEYKDSYQAIVKNADKSEYEVAGGKTPKAQTTNDLPQGNTSPFSNVKLPERPETGAKQ